MEHRLRKKQLIASDSWVFDVWCRAFEDAAMLCFQESEWFDGSGASYLLKNEGFW